MRNNVVIYFLCYSLLFSSCIRKEESNNDVHITLRTNSLTDTLSISSTLIATHIFIDTIVSTHTNDIKFPLTEPAMVLFNLNETTSKIYLEPGFDIYVTVKQTNNNRSVYFEGDGSVINNYLLKKDAIFAPIIKKGISLLDSVVFIRTIDSLEAVINNFAKGYIDSVNASDKYILLIHKMNDLQLAILKEEYAFYLYNSAIVEQYYSFRSGRDVSKFTMPDKLKFNSQKLLNDALLLKLRDSDYNTLAFYYLMVEVHSPLIDYRNIGKPDNFKWVFESHSQLKGGEFSSVIKEYLLASNISHCLDNRKTTPPIDSIFKDFQKNYGDSQYTAAFIG